MSKQPSTAVPLKLRHVLSGMKGLSGEGKIRKFEAAFAEFNGSRHAVTAGNGTTAMYISLLAMKELKPDRNEVILPAYTVPAITHAFNRAGLKTVLCDIDRETFNMDPESMASVVTDRTLAVIPVHMFGFPCNLDKALQVGKERGAFVIEDACQAPGARLNGKRVGTFGDSGFFSLCKGKNVSTFHGGILVTDSDDLAGRARKIVKTLPPRSFTYRMSIPAVLAAFSFAVRPWFYGIFYPMIARFKDTTVHETFHPTVYNGFMAGVGNALLPRLEEWNAVRARNGLALMEGLEGDDGLIMPRIIEGAEPVFNHLPLVFHDIGRMEKAQEQLFERGIDTGRMYERPINHIFDWLEYERDPEPFPDAAYIAPRLLTLPTHPYITERDNRIMIETVKNTA